LEEGKLTSVVEAFKTRHFQGGRLDLAPTCTDEVAQFITVYSALKEEVKNQNTKGSINLTAPELIDLRKDLVRESFIKACESVGTVATDVKKGNTVLTHLMAANAQMWPSPLSTITEKLLSTHVEAMKETFRYGSVSSNGGNYEGIAAFGTAPSEATTKAIGYKIGKDKLTFDLVAAPSSRQTADNLKSKLTTICHDILSLY
jgi:hypothetical protein